MEEQKGNKTRKIKGVQSTLLYHVTNNFANMADKCEKWQLRQFQSEFAVLNGTSGKFKCVNYLITAVFFKVHQ